MVRCSEHRTRFRDQRLDAVLPQIGRGTTSKSTRLGCSKDAPLFAAVNSGRVRILNRPFVSNVSCLGSIRLEDNTSHRATIPCSFGLDNRVVYKMYYNAITTHGPVSDTI